MEMPPIEIERHFVLKWSGLDFLVLLWDPFLTEPVGRLPKQESDIVEVLFNDAFNQILIVTEDKKIQVCSLFCCC